MKITTVAQAKSVSNPGFHRADPTLYLRVAPGGSKQWVQRITIEGRRRDMGLGAFPVVSLAKARQRAFEHRVAIVEGRNPLAERRKAKMPTFGQAAQKTFEALKSRWRNAKHTKSWMQTLQRHAFPILAEMPVDRIGREEMLRVLTPIWATRPETARRVRSRIRAVLQWAMAHGFVDRNMAGEVIDGALPNMRPTQSHFRSLSYSKVPAALETVEASGTSESAKLCLRFVVLTAARSGEARLANWDEIDTENALWIIPAERMKAAREHRVPLSDASLDVLERAQQLRDGSGLVFPSPYRPGKPLSDMTLTKVLRTTGLAKRATVHGFRTSFRVWASERTNADHAVMELSLAHAVGYSVEQAYARSDLLAKRRRLMQRWSEFLVKNEGEEAEVARHVG